MRNILAFVSDAFGGRGGIAQYNRDFLSALGEAQADSPIVVLPRQGRASSPTPAGVEQLRPRPGLVSYVLAAIGLALRRRVDLVFCGHINMSPLCWIIARSKRARFIVQLHGVDAWDRPQWLRRRAVEHADLVLCVSRFTRDACVRWAAIRPERVKVLPNTMGDAFSPGDGSSLRRSLGLEGKYVLLTVGRMDSPQRSKGHAIVVHAIPGLIAKGHDVAYVIVGDGPDRSRVEGLVRTAGLDDRVRFLGEVSTERLVEAYRMADLFVMPSTGEGFGIVFIEAMASGTPALGLSAGGSADALADGELGTLARPEEFAAVMAKLIEAPKRDPKGLAAAVRARFGRDRFAADLRAAIDRVMEAT